MITCVGEAIVNVALLTSNLQVLEASKILTRHCVDGVFGMVQVYVPLAAFAVVVMVVQVAPLSVEYWMVRLVEVPLAAQVMFCVGPPTCHDSPPFGVFTMIARFWLMVNGALLTSVAAGNETSVTRIRQLVEGVFGTVPHVYEQLVPAPAL